MQACHLHEFAAVPHCRVETVAAPTAQEDEILIETHAFGLNFPDLLMLQGKYQERYPTPFVPGRDAAGIVAAVGPGVANFKRGDRVMCQVSRGAWAEYIAAPVSRCYPMPRSAPFTDAAAMITPYNTAYIAMMARAHVRPGDIAVVTGASGSVGTALVQLLKAQGVCVVGIVSSAPKVDYVRNLGADGVVVAAGGDLKRSLADGIHTVTRGENADVVFDTVGGDLFDAALRVLKSEGRLIVLGFAGGRIPEVRVNYLLLKNIAVVGAPLDVNFAAHPAMIADGARYVGELYERGALRPHVKAIIGFPHIAEALDAAADSSVPGRVTVQLKS